MGGPKAGVTFLLDRSYDEAVYFRSFYFLACGRLSCQQQ